MPETSRDLNNSTPGSEDDIRLSGQILGMQAIAVSELVQDLPDRQLRLGILTLVCQHVVPAAGSDTFEDRAGRLAWGWWRGHHADMDTPENHPSVRQADGSSDRRWVVLCEDGRVSTLGRARDPDEEDIRRAEDGLRAQGLAGWLAVQSHSAYAEPPPTFIEVRPLGTPTVTFTEAVAAFHLRMSA
jgi:hypothetical protein